MTEKMICWNHHGARSGQIHRKFKNLMKTYNPVILILLEPKVSGAMNDVVCNKIGMSKGSQSEADGFNGGVWVLWKEVEQKIGIRYAHKFCPFFGGL